MESPRLTFLHMAAGAAAVQAVSRFAWSQAYPARPVRLLVGFAPGGTQDVIGRLLGQWLTERLGQQVIIENRPGAASNIAAEAATHRAAQHGDQCNPRRPQGEGAAGRHGWNDAARPARQLRPSPRQRN